MQLIRQLFERQLVGLDIGVSGIKAVELNTSKGFRLVAYNRIPLPWDVLTSEGEVADRETLVRALKTLFDFKGFSTKRVAVGAFGNSIITKKIQLPQMPESELKEQLYWEAEQYIPFPVADVNLDFVILGPSSGKTSSGTPAMDVLLVAAKKEYIRNLTSIVEEAGLVPAVVDSQPFALGNTFEFNYGATEAREKGLAGYALIDFGAGTTKITVVDGDKTSFTRELRQSGLALSRWIAERLRCSLEEAENMKVSSPDQTQIQPLIREYNQGWLDEVVRTLDFCMSQNPERSLTGVYVCGGGSLTEGLVEQLESRNLAPVKRLNPVQSIPGSGKRMNAEAIREILSLGAVAIGLALRTQGDGE